MNIERNYDQPAPTVWQAMGTLSKLMFVAFAALSFSGLLLSLAFGYLSAMNYYGESGTVNYSNMSSIAFAQMFAFALLAGFTYFLAWSND